MIRSAKADDLPDLPGLLEQLFSVEEDFSFDAEKQSCGLKLLYQSSEARVMVAERSGRAVGMATGQLLVSTAEGCLSLVVEDLVVDAEHRGQGLGSRLLEALADWGRSRGALRMQLLADRNNNQALKFYKSQQWQETSLICLHKFHNKKT